MSDQVTDTMDQTTFSESAPMTTEDGVKKTVPKKEPAPEEPVKRPIKKPIPLPLLIVAIVAVLLVVVLVAAVFRPRTPLSTQITTGEPTPTPVTTSNLPIELQKAITTLSQDIEGADPKINDLPFPPVNFGLHLRAAGTTEE